MADRSIAGLKGLIDRVTESLIKGEQQLKSYQTILDSLNVSGASRLPEILANGYNDKLKK